MRGEMMSDINELLMKMTQEEGKDFYPCEECGQIVDEFDAFQRPENDAMVCQECR